MNDCSGKSQLFLHAVRVVRNHGFGAIGELHEFQQLVAALAGSRFVEAIHAADKFQVLGRVEAFEETHALRNNADLAFDLDGMLRKIKAEK